MENNKENLYKVIRAMAENKYFIYRANKASDPEFAREYLNEYIILDTVLDLFRSEECFNAAYDNFKDDIREM